MFGHITLKRYFTLLDFRGLSRLVLEATEGLTDTVEEIHHAISTPFGPFGASTRGRMRGITGLVYRTIHASYGLVGNALDAALQLLDSIVDDPPPSPERETMLAILNGVWGDHLAADANPLAIEMSLRQDGRPLILEREAIQETIPDVNGKVLVLVHGLCMNDLGRSRDGHDHGAALARDLGHTPVYLHYNSGLHISSNGREFANLLEKLIGEWPCPVEELTIVGHSMGGLVARSACHYGALAGHTWPADLRNLIFLGTPHHGSRLEQVGNWASELLKATRYTAPFWRLGSSRSAGITDLRFGNLVDEDWAGQDRFARRSDARHPVPLPADVRCYAMGATVGTTADDVRKRLLGDGFVHLESALGLHEDADRCLGFPTSQQCVVYGTPHSDLLARPQVYGKIREWLTT
jgi:pimeloyl-ACP methyl ester carboxylesterase